MKFGYKLTISYLVLTIIPILAIGYYAYNLSVQYVEEETKQNVAGTLKQARDNIIERMNVVKLVDDQLYLDQRLQKTLAIEYDQHESYKVMVGSIIPKLESAFNVTSNPILIDLYLYNTTLPEIYYVYGEEDPLLRGKQYEIIHHHRIADEQWNKAFEADTAQYEWLQSANDQQHGNISFLRKMLYFTNIKPIGIMKITVKLSDLFGDLNYSQHENGTPSYLMITNEANEIVYQSVRNPVPEDWTQAPQNYWQIEEHITGLDWKIVALVPVEKVKEGIVQVRNLTVFVCLISFVILAAISLFTSKYFSKRIRRIVFALKSFQEGDFSKRIRHFDKDELGEIATAFNEMAYNTEGLIEEVYVSKLEKKEAELQALQAQIKPHFLYNTLSSISRLAKLGETAKLHEMVTGLATFYRLTLNQGNAIISIQKELQQVQAYIAIQKIKHLEQLQVSYDIDSTILPYYTVKLILQPFVENALEHGMYDDRLHIRIVAYSENNNIVFKVIDDGIGMHRDTISKIMNRYENNSGYGMRNVDDRIRLQFGSAFGISIHSRLGIGTTIQIVIPRYRE